MVFFFQIAINVIEVALKPCGGSHPAPGPYDIPILDSVPRQTKGETNLCVAPQFVWAGAGYKEKENGAR